MDIRDKGSLITVTMSVLGLGLHGPFSGRQYMNGALPPARSGSQADQRRETTRRLAGGSTTYTREIPQPVPFLSRHGAQIGVFGFLP